MQCTDAKACVDTSGKTLLVLVTDYCKGCGGDYVFLAPSAYGAAAGATTLGRVAGFFRQVRWVQLALGWVRGAPSSGCWTLPTGARAAACAGGVQGALNAVQFPACWLLATGAESHCALCVWCWARLPCLPPPPSTACICLPPGGV